MCALQIKHPNFLTLKKAFPHGIIAMSTCGHAVFAMKMGVLHEQYSQIEEAGLSNDDIVKHLALVYEYAFCKLDPKPLPGGQLINVLDFDGLGIMDMRGAPSHVLSRCCEVCGPVKRGFAASREVGPLGCDLQARRASSATWRARSASTTTQTACTARCSSTALA